MIGEAHMPSRNMLRMSPPKYPSEKRCVYSQQTDRGGGMCLLSKLLMKQCWKKKEKQWKWKVESAKLKIPPDLSYQPLSSHVSCLFLNYKLIKANRLKNTSKSPVSLWNHITFHPVTAQ